MMPMRGFTNGNISVKCMRLLIRPYKDRTAFINAWNDLKDLSMLLN
jgi:hypothetical protein